MGEEEIRKIAKEEFMNNVMKQLNSSLIFTYIQKLENQLQQKENIIKEVREYIEEQLKSYSLHGTIKDMRYIDFCKLLEILDKDNK